MILYNKKAKELCKKYHNHIFIDPSGKLYCNNLKFDKSPSHPVPVDLGLPSGTQWSKYNIGAIEEEDAGWYLSYGEISKRDINQKPFIPENAPYYENGNYTKYIDSRYDYTLFLEPIDDIATMMYGREYTVPSAMDFNELIDNTNQEWIENYNNSGINGMKFINKNDSSKYIFIPAAGAHVDSEFTGFNETGILLTSSLDLDDLSIVNVIYFENNTLEQRAFERFPGYSIRPVYKVQPNDEIWYYTLTGEILNTDWSGDEWYEYPFNVNIISHTYENGKGVIKFDGELTSIGPEAFSGVFMDNDEADNILYLSIPNSVISIGSYLFSYSGKLQTFIFPESVLSISGDYPGYILPDGFGYKYKIFSYNKEQADKICNDWNWRYPVIDVYLNNKYYGETTRNSCFLPGTQITLADGTRKNVEDLEYTDELLVFNFDEGCIQSAPILWLTRPGLMNDHYYKLTFSDGTILKVTGLNSNHRVFSLDDHEFIGAAYIEVGTTVYSETAPDHKVILTEKEKIEEEIEYYSVVTDQHLNCFAEGILACNRNGIYPISDEMKYIKEGREFRPYTEYKNVGIERYWYDGLRLGEVSDTLEKSLKTVNRFKNQMKPLNTNKE